MMTKRFTDEEIAIAKSVDLVSIAESLGYTPKRIGRYYTLKEMDSIRIHDRRTWFRWSRQYEPDERGGSQIEFLKAFTGMDFKESVSWLLDFAGYQKLPDNQKQKPLKHQAPEKKAEKKNDFVLPSASKDHSYLLSYLTGERGLRKEVVQYFLDKGLIYESKPYHNIVFKGLDKDGICRFASMRGVFDKGGKPFKCDVEGNDKTYGFNVVCKDSHEVYVFEGAIDLMSYMDIHSDFSTNMIALGMTADAPLETFLKENPQISGITFCLDNDEAGRKATAALLKKYYERGYDVEDYPPPKGYKDYNEWLQAQRVVKTLLEPTQPMKTAKVI